MIKSSELIDEINKVLQKYYPIEKSFNDIKGDFILFDGLLIIFAFNTDILIIIYIITLIF